MKKSATILIIGFFLILLFSFQYGKKENTSTNTAVEFYIPEGWPQPNYDFDKNTITKETIYLGRVLFYDAKLSRDGSTSCANCHLVYTGFTHVDHALSHGIEDRIGTRNSLSIINPAWQSSFMWDGAINHIEKQPLAPLTNFLEMDNNLDSLLIYLKSSPKYISLYEKAFGSDEEISIPKTSKAISHFMLQFNSYNSKYGKVMRNEPNYSFTKAEAQGYELFKKNCSSCHKEPLFSTNNFMSNGLPIDTTLMDGGRIKVTHRLEDSLLFRVPTLRNIEATYPYMHDGRFANLQMVLNHYVDQEKNTFNLSEELKPMHLSEKDKQNIILFLKTLTDMEFLRNKELNFPQ